MLKKEIQQKNTLYAISCFLVGSVFLSALLIKSKISVKIIIGSIWAIPFWAFLFRFFIFFNVFITKNLWERLGTFTTERLVQKTKNQFQKIEHEIDLPAIIEFGTLKKKIALNTLNHDC